MNIASGYPYPYYMRVKSSYDYKSMFDACYAKVTLNELMNEYFNDDHVDNLKAGAIVSVIVANRTQRNQCIAFDENVFFRADLNAYVDEWSMYVQ